MLLAIDVGNTNVVFALLQEQSVAAKWRIATEVKRTMDEYAIILKELMSLDDLGFDDVSAVIISSVVPQSLFALKELSKNFCQCSPIIVGDKNVHIGIKIQLDLPEEVGADRIVNAVAAYDKYKKSCVVIDFGTATTFDIINGEGDYIGGLIAPGINLSIDSLHRAAAKLPEIAIKKPDNVIGKSTISAMQSGIYFGYLGLIEGIIRRIKDELNNELNNEGIIVIATGGLAALFVGSTAAIDNIEDDLTINGLLKIYNLNN